MAERVPQTWTAHQEFVLGAVGTTAEDDLTREALSQYRHYLVIYRNIGWISGGGVGGYEKDPYAIMTEKFVDDNNFSSSCSEECPAEIFIEGPDGTESVTATCTIGGFATKKAALEQEAKCATCLNGKTWVITSEVMAANVTVQRTQASLDEEKTQHAVKVRGYEQTLRNLL